MVDIERLWQFWNEVLRMSPGHRRLEVMIRALTTVDMALRRVRAGRSRQKVIHTWIALVDQSEILRTTADAWDIYRELKKVLEDCDLKVDYVQAVPLAYRGGMHIPIGLSIKGPFKRVDLKIFRTLRNGFSAQREYVCATEEI